MTGFTVVFRVVFRGVPLAMTMRTYLTAPSLLALISLLTLATLSALASCAPLATLGTSSFGRTTCVRNHYILNEYFILVCVKRKRNIRRVLV
jgi:hypothetical protein